MSIFKKNKSNYQSRMPYTNAVRDSHNDEQHATDVLLVNDFVPKRYVKVEYQYKDMGDGTFEVEYVNFYGEGTQHETWMNCRGDVPGRAEITAINFMGKKPSDLGGKYFVTYDEIGSVGVWFNLDNGSVMPVTGALRNISVAIQTQDEPSQLASKTKTTLNGDPKFICANQSYLLVITSSTVGDKPNAEVRTSGLIISPQKGLDPLNNKYFHIFSNNDETKYTVYANVDGLGVSPAIAGTTDIMVPLSSTDNANTVASKYKTAIENGGPFTVTIDGSELHIINYYNGFASASYDVNSDHGFIKAQVAGSNGSIVAKIKIVYDPISKLRTSIEKMI